MHYPLHAKKSSQDIPFVDRSEILGRGGDLAIFDFG